jgi:hypothetical protein
MSVLSVLDSSPSLAQWRCRISLCDRRDRRSSGPLLGCVRPAERSPRPTHSVCQCGARSPQSQGRIVPGHRRTVVHATCCVWRPILAAPRSAAARPGPRISRMAWGFCHSGSGQTAAGRAACRLCAPLGRKGRWPHTSQAHRPPSRLRRYRSRLSPQWGRSGCFRPRFVPLCRRCLCSQVQDCRIGQHPEATLHGPAVILEGCVDDQ